MKRYTYGAYDWHGHLVELTVVADNKAEAGKMARGILDGAREFIDTDEGIFLNNEEDYK